MTAIGGAPESVTLDGREFPVASDADVNQDKGGFSNESQANGNGSARKIMTRKLWKLEGVNVAIDRSNDDLGYLQDLANRLDYFPITIAYSDGAVFQARGSIDGDLMHATGTATASLTLSGPGEITPQ